MSKYFTITILVILFVFLILPQTVSAGLVPCGRTPGEGVPIEETQPCNLCHFFVMAQRLLNGIGLVFLAWAAIFIVIGGITIMTAGGSAESVAKGKKMITYAIVGVVIGLSSWLIINETIVLLSGSVKDSDTGQELGQIKGVPWPWSRIKCVPGEAPEEEKKEEGGELESVKNYCACEIPVYTVDPTAYPDASSEIGTELKATKLSDEDECTKECVSGNSSTYCSQRSLTDEATEGNFYCASQNDLEAKETTCIELVDEVVNIDCFSTKDKCAFSVLPDKPEFNEEYAKKCWVDENFYCECTSGQATWCGSSKPYGLYVKKKEKGLGTYKNAYDCIRYCGKVVYEGEVQGENCRLGSFWQEPEPEPEPDINKCDKVIDKYSCFGGKFECKKMTHKQESAACEQLKIFLNCWATHVHVPSGKVISSISDNSPPIYEGSPLGKCFDTGYWEEHGQCSASADSCAGTCCGHSKPSLHYGGKPPGEGGVSGCRQCSLAVDFAMTEDFYNQNKEGFKDVAEDCAESYFEEFGEVCLIYEGGNHLHVQLTGISKNSYCGTGLKDNKCPE